MDPDFELPISLPSRDSRNLLRALHGQLRAAILDGRLQPGSRLPPTRALAAAYGVSRNTAVAAYDLLLSEGYLAPPVRGPEPTWRTSAPVIRSTGPRQVPRWTPIRACRRFGANRPFLFHLHLPDFDAVRLSTRSPDKRFFPFDVWRRLTARAIRSLREEAGRLRGAAGLPGLREAIAKHVSFARAVACRPEDIVVTAGSQQALRSPRPHPDLSGPNRGRRRESRLSAAARGLRRRRRQDRTRPG